MERLLAAFGAAAIGAFAGPSLPDPRLKVLRCRAGLSDNVGIHLAAFDRDLNSPNLAVR